MRKDSLIEQLLVTVLFALAPVCLVASCYVSGCSVKNHDLEMPLKCPQYAAMEAAAFVPASLPVRVAVGRTASGQLHATGQVLLSDGWHDIGHDHWTAWARTKDRELDTVYNWFTLEEWVSFRRRYKMDVEDNNANPGP